MVASSGWVRLKGVARKIPGVRWIYHSIRSAYVGFKLRRSTTEEVFTDIHVHNRWGGAVSLSGTGSDLDRTRVLRRELPGLFRELRVSTLLDIPCGDFHWMKTVDLNGIVYLGGDIVRDLIRRNEQAYEKPGIEFQHLNLIADPLPKADFVFCRDCLVHFSYADILRALRNLYLSGSEYLFTTTFVDRVQNHDILTGDWRPLNVAEPPFSFPRPLRMLNEECNEANGAYRDKAMGLWRISELAGVIGQLTARLDRA